MNVKHNKIAVVSWVFCQTFIVENFLKIREYPSVADFEDKKRLDDVKRCDLLQSGLTFCTLEAMFTTTEENEVALSLFCDFGIFSQDQFCL